MFETDKKIIRELANRTAEIAALPVQAEKRALWRGLNGLSPARPMVMIDQVCWNEMYVDDGLKLQCEDPMLREWESELKKQLYQWKYFPVDMVVDGVFYVPKAVWDTGNGIQAVVRHLKEDETGDVSSQAYENQITSMEDVARIKVPQIIHDKAETERRRALAEEVFDGIMPVCMEGMKEANIALDVWDQISFMMGVENACYALADKPEMMHALASRLVEIKMARLDQLEQMDLLCGPQSLIHCTGAWNDDLPKERSAPWTTKQIWTFGLAQMFSTVSPRMFGEYEVDICMLLYERFGLLYYGCCDPLDLKMEQVRRIPNVRKVSMSPWASKERGASEIGGDYVFSHKPNPAYLVHFDEDLIRGDIRETVQICKANGCPLELILKDVSTVMYKPQNLWRWAQIAMEEACK
ncbi:MAG: hypothetical protein FWE90_01870 [Defluviitaleaceae bacterium]|nr:hypothetical protein [Defluviitaleaceae bacterium]